MQNQHDKSDIYSRAQATEIVEDKSLAGRFMDSMAAVKDSVVSGAQHVAENLAQATSIISNKAADLTHAVVYDSQGSITTGKEAPAFLKELVKAASNTKWGSWDYSNAPVLPFLKELRDRAGRRLPFKSELLEKVNTNTWSWSGRTWRRAQVELPFKHELIDRVNTGSWSYIGKDYYSRPALPFVREMLNRVNTNTWSWSGKAWRSSRPSMPFKGELLKRADSSTTFSWSKPWFAHAHLPFSSELFERVNNGSWMKLRNGHLPIISAEGYYENALWKHRTIAKDDVTGITAEARGYHTEKAANEHAIKNLNLKISLLGAGSACC